VATAKCLVVGLDDACQKKCFSSITKMKICKLLYWICNEIAVLRLCNWSIREESIVLCNDWSIADSQ